MVMKRPKRFIHVMGLVHRPDQYEIPDEIPDPRLLDAIAMAGSQTLSVADKVHIIRQLPDRPDPVVIEASIPRRQGRFHLQHSPRRPAT